MKRFSALALSVLLLVGIAVPTVLADSSSAPETEAAASASSSAEEPQQEVPAGEEEEGGSVPDAAEAAPDEESTASAGLSLTSLLNASKDTPANPDTALHFSQLRTVMSKYNYTIRYMQATMSDLRDSNDGMDAMISAISGLEAQVKSALSNARNFVAMNSDDLDDEDADSARQDLVNAYKGLITSLEASDTLLNAQISSLTSQLNSLDDTIDSTQNTLRDSINQMVKGAESLYIALVTMEASVDGVQRQLNTLDRAIAITEKRQELGMASAYELETMRYQRSQAASGLETLKYQIKTNKMQLEYMCGMSMKGTVQLDPLTMPTEEELNSVDYDGNLAAATRKNVDVLNAEIERSSDMGDSGASDYHYSAARSTFAYKFQIICMDVPENRRLLETAQEAVDYQQRTFEIAEKKYALGMSSHEDYLSAQNDLLSAKDDLYNAQLNLLTAYRSYVWAVEYGLV